jgi:glutaredoxin
MRMRFLVALLLLPALAQAQLYRWVDDKGKVHYSDQAPLPGAKNVQKQSTSVGQGSSAPLPYALQQAVRNLPVTLYTSEVCKEACAQARELLDKRGVPYSEVSVNDEEGLTQLKKLSGGNVVPVLTVGQEVYKGFERGAFKAALDSAGYPTSSLLPPGVKAGQLVGKAAAKAAPAAGEAGGKPATAAQETADTVAPK